MATTTLSTPVDTEPSAPPKPRSPFGRLRYREAGPRDRRLDLLRGFALFAMSANHFGMHHSHIHLFTGRSQFLISAAEAFLFISGLTLGVVSIGRSREQITDRLLSRTWTVYLATIGISFGFAAIAMHVTTELWGWFDPNEHDGRWAWIGQVLTLRTAFNGADILIAYVAYLTVAVVALRLMASGRTGVVIGGVVGVYAFSQVAGPEALDVPIESFRALAPNAPLFFGGLVLGYHCDAIARWWSRFPLHRLIDGGIVAAAIVLAWLHRGGWEHGLWLGEWINGEDVNGPLGRREFEMPFSALAVVGLYLRAGWLLVDRLWVLVERSVGWLLLPLGEASLFTFVAHLAAIPTVWWIASSGYGEDDSSTLATMWTGGYLGLIWGAALVRNRIVRQLRSGMTRSAQIRAHGPAVAVWTLALVVVVGWTGG